MMTSGMAASREQMRLVNRGVLIIKPKQPFVDWANSLPDPVRVTVEELSKDCTAILVLDVDDAEAYLRRIYRSIFEMELDGWHSDESCWPKKRDYRTFRAWFDVEFHSMVFDASDSALFREVE